MIVTPEFPEHRLQDPRRQAEWRVYQEIAGSQAPGRAFYEMRAGGHVPQLDFGIWLQDVAHYGLQVKGGETATEGGEWRLHSANGPETIPSPIAQTFDAAIAIRDIIKAQLHRKVFIFPVLCFPDMAPDPIIEARAAEGHVTVFWGGDDLIGRMKELAKTQTIHRPPTAERIAQEVELIQPGMGHPAGAPGPAPAPANADAVVELPGGRLVVHVHVHLPRDSSFSAGRRRSIRYPVTYSSSGASQFRVTVPSGLATAVRLVGSGGGSMGTGSDTVRCIVALGKGRPVLLPLTAWVYPN